MAGTDRRQNEIRRIKALDKERTEILSMAPEKALNRILDHPQPAALVHSFPEEDLYFLIHDIGPEDALPLLALASGRQLDFILDQEIWEKDRIDPLALTNWFDLMLKTEPARFIKWLTQERINLLEFYLYKNIELRIREHDQDPSEFGEDFITFDNVFYIRILPLDQDEIQAAAVVDQDIVDDDKRMHLLKTILECMASMDFTTYRNIILESVHVLPAETEEEEFRLRNIRLSEKGFLPFDEAVGIYQPITPERIYEKRSSIDKKKFFSGRMIATPMTPLKLLDADNIFSRALAHISTDERIEALQTEFAALCNQLAVADQKKIKDRKMLEGIVKKACGYIAMGLEMLTNKGEKPGTAVNLILKYPVADIFRVGYGRVMALKRQAEKWIADSWFSHQGLSLNFWGEEWLGVLGGLLIKRPLFFDNYKTGVLYREFESSTELEQTRKILNDIIAFDRLLSLTDIRIHPSTTRVGVLFYKNLVLTLWARHYLGLPGEAAHLTMSQFRQFYGSLWRKKTRPKKIADAMKSSFLSFLAQKTGLEALDITHQVGPILENLFLEIEREYGEVSADDLDARYVQLFLIK